MIELSVIDIREKIKKKEFTCLEITKAYIDEIKKQSHLNAVIEIFDDACNNALVMDKKIASGFSGKLAGVPIIISDNILYKGHIVSAASKMLKNYIADYSSTAVSRLIDEGAIIIARANMDEFAIGCDSSTSIYGKTLNPIDNTMTIGGASGGSAVSVAANLCAAAISTDTSGALRQASAYCGLVGIKPTYGRISRYGAIAVGSSFDQIGSITKCAKDNALLLEVMSGADNNDETSIKDSDINFMQFTSKDIKGLKIGIIDNLSNLIKNNQVENTYLSMIDFIKNNNAEIVKINIDNLDVAIETHYIISSAEFTSNMARYDGVKYAYRDESATNLEDIYRKSRSSGLGDAVKSKIMFGNYVLTKENFDIYFNKAKAIQSQITDNFNKAFEKCDIILMPTTLEKSFKSDNKNHSDVFKEDIFTVGASLTGLPAISMPFIRKNDNQPIGMQFVAPALQESRLYQIADYIERMGGQK